MIEIKHKDTGEVLHTVEGDTLRGADLRGADLRKAEMIGADLKGVDLSGTRLIEAEMIGANLREADLSDANLTGADLSNVDLILSTLIKANLSGANLSDANLSHSDLTRADLREANLSGARLIEAYLRKTELSGADLSGARLSNAVFLQCETLYQAKNLEAILHVGPSSLDAVTLRACVAHLPDVFLQGVGYTNEEIEYLRAMYQQGIQYYSCFISYAKANSDFATHLHDKLVSSNVSCWQDIYDLRGGEFWRKQINEAIKIYDKLIVVCSQASLSRKEVVEEIIEAIEYEREAGAQKLFPVRLDSVVFTLEAEDLAYKLLPPRQRREDWLTYLRDYHVPDFSGWKDFDTFQREFEKLLKALKNPEKR